jgi:hypothetical protein
VAPTAKELDAAVNDLKAKGTVIFDRAVALAATEPLEKQSDCSECKLRRQFGLCKSVVNLANSFRTVKKSVTKKFARFGFVAFNYSVSSWKPVQVLKSYSLRLVV